MKTEIQLAQTEWPVWKCSPLAGFNRSLTPITIESNLISFTFDRIERDGVRIGIEIHGQTIACPDK